MADERYMKGPLPGDLQARIGKETPHLSPGGRRAMERTFRRAQFQWGLDGNLLALRIGRGMAWIGMDQGTYVLAGWDLTQAGQRYMRRLVDTLTGFYTTKEEQNVGPDAATS